MNRTSGIIQIVVSALILTLHKVRCTPVLCVGKGKCHFYYMHREMFR